MNKNRFEASFWEDKYRSGQLGWDMGSVSPPIRAYIDQLESTDLSILIPGAGNSYEAEYLHQKGFGDLDVLDIAEQPLLNLKQRVEDFPESRMIHTDFFSWQKKYDLILEQTFFCALEPGLRMSYAEKVHELLKPGGKLVGLLFDFELSESGPPFGGSVEEYLETFEPWFEIRTLERCYNSIKPRSGSELFIIFERRKLDG